MAYLPGPFRPSACIFKRQPNATVIVLPRRPFLLRAMFEWVLANGQTPHILVDASMDNVQVPADYIENEQIILNIRPQAITGLDLSNDAISFNARFGGRPYSIYVPMEAVVALYARESGDGMAFPPEPFATNDDDPEPAGPDDSRSNSAGSAPNKSTTTQSRRPALKIVK